MLEEMLDSTRDSLSDLASSDDEEHGEDADDTEQCKLSEDDEPSGVMCTIPKTVKQCIERLRQKQIKHDQLTQSGWGDAADYFCERDKRYRTTEMKVPAVVKSHMDEDVVYPKPSTFGELMESLDITPRISQMPHGSSRPSSNHLRLGTGRLQLNKCIASRPPEMEPDLWPMKITKHIEPVSLYPCIFPSG
jgi:hypothetical protein